MTVVAPLCYIQSPFMVFNVTDKPWTNALDVLYAWSAYLLKMFKTTLVRLHVDACVT